jgi:hypothetical protein
MPGRETTVSSIPSDNSTFDEERGAAKSSRTAARDAAKTCRACDQPTSIDSIRRHKPHLSCFASIEPVLGVPKKEVLFASSNNFDVGAEAFGFNVAWIRRRDRKHPATMFGILRGTRGRTRPPPTMSFRL